MSCELNRADSTDRAKRLAALKRRINGLKLTGRFIEQGQPLVTLHGHIHESARLTGSWRDRIVRTHLFGAAHDGAELALVRFDLEDPDSAMRQLL